MLLAEVVKVLDFLVQLDPVGTFEVPVAAQQVVAQHGAFFVGFLVGLQFQQGVDKVQKLGVGIHALGLADYLQQALARRTVTFRKSLEGNILAFGKVVAGVLNVFVHGVVGIDV